MRNLFELLYYIRETLLLLLAVLVALVLLLTGDSRQSFALQGYVAAATGAVPRPSLGISDMIGYRDKNQVLRERVTKYRLLNAELADMARENERLRRMLRFTKESPHKLQVAEVVSRGASSVLSTLTLNIGSHHGVVPNVPVLTMDGLLGKTLTVARNATIIQLISDRNFRVSVKVGAEGSRGILKPLYGLSAEVTGIPVTVPIRPGDAITTSGFSDIYPKNLPVGVVAEVESVPGENFSRLKVRLHANPFDVEHVFVMVIDGPDS